MARKVFRPEANNIIPMPIYFKSPFLKDRIMEKYKDDPERIKKELYEINHSNYIRNKEKIIAQHREYRKRKREAKKQLLAVESV